jgi:hypothetical protein
VIKLSRHASALTASFELESEFSDKVWKNRLPDADFSIIRLVPTAPSNVSYPVTPQHIVIIRDCA